MTFAPALLIVALVAALHYAIRYVHAPVGWPRSITKTIPLACLTLFAAIADAPLLIIAALALSAIGDAALSRDGDRWFLIGLISFLIAHLTYIVLFLPLAKTLNPNTFSTRTSIALPILLFWGVLLISGLWSYLGTLRAPVVLYTAATLIMVQSAILLPAGYGCATLGAVLFAISDTALGLQVFAKRRIPAHSEFIWWTYIAAQSLIMAAFL